MNDVLLSICIPTYNRATYLDLCLQHFCQELNQAVDKIEIIVFDNCSTDNTREIVAKYAVGGCSIQFFQNSSNLGAETNMVNCLEKIKGEYFWLFGDDDLLLEGKMAIILEQLRKRCYAMLYLGNYWFKDDYLVEMPIEKQPRAPVEYQNKKALLKKINIWATFISAGIFKNDVLKKIDLRAHIGTNLNQLQWVLPAIFADQKCLYLPGNMIACKSGNTGGYELFNTFGNNLTGMVNDLCRQKLVPSYTERILNYYIIKDFMPLYCIRYKQHKLGDFHMEISPFIMLKKLYKSYFIYWLVIFPLDIFPVFIGKKYYYGLKKIKII